MKISVINILAFVFLWSCHSERPGNWKKVELQNSFPYTLESPAKKFILPKSLREISGITAVNDSVIACIEDEHGIVYFYNLNSSEIINKIPFTDRGDFEDITCIRDTLYVLDSKGVIWVIKNYQKTPLVQSYPLAIEPPFELEGLCHRRDTLFIAAKYYHNKKRDQAGLLPVWKLLPSMQVGAPVFSLPDLINPTGNLDVPFHTSALAFSEAMKEWFCISTHTKAFIQCDLTGNIINIQSLSAQEFSQPEGICFTPSGDLLISNEGRDRHATILLFTHKKNRK